MMVWGLQITQTCSRTRVGMGLEGVLEGVLGEEVVGQGMGRRVGIKEGRQQRMRS